MKKITTKLASICDCTGCMLCADVCPKNAIHFRLSNNGFWEPKVNADKCVECKICEKKCMEVREAKIVSICNQPLKGYAISDNVRLRSTSGGAFFALAETAILLNKAIVYGAVCEDTNVHHIGVNTIDDLRKLQGSKYVQSSTWGIYKEVKQNLQEGRFVLFSGTPCQINALCVFLKKKFEKLLCVDLICHGVPSHKLMYRHLAINGGDGVVQFRTKDKGWGRDSVVSISKGDKTVVVENPSKNLFFHAFQSELCFRLNCYKCRYNDIHRIGDITIGDYWAARFSDEDDKLGISTILANTEKGRDFVNGCANLHVEITSWYNTLKYNPRLYTNRKEYLSIALSNRIGEIYRFLPNRFADYILEAWYSRRRHIFYLWAKYIQCKQNNFDKNKVDNLLDIVTILEAKNKS